MDALRVEGARVRLRPVTVPDLAVYRAWQRPDAAWRQMDGPYYPSPTEEELDQMIATLTATVSNMLTSPRSVVSTRSHSRSSRSHIHP